MKGLFRMAAAAAACTFLVSCGGGGAGGDAGVDATADDAALDAESDAGVDAVSDSGADVADVPGDVAETPLPVEAWGPYAVGYKVFETTDAQRGDRAVPIAVYYPALGDAAPADTVVTCDYEKSQLPNSVSVADAAPAGRAFPVVVFSHGSGASKEMYKYLLEFLASHGWVAVAPDHTGNVGFFAMTPEDMEMTSLRVTDMLWTIAWLGSAVGDEAGALHGLADMNRLAVMGHSYGGHIVMAMGGAAWDWDHIADQCAQAEPPDPYVCSLQNHKDEWADTIPSPAVKAAISLANDASEVHFGLDCAGAGQIDVPVMYVGGTKDTIAVFDDNAAICYPKTPSPACLVKLEGAGHLDFTDAMAEGDMACDRSHHIIRGMVLAFLEKSLNGTAGTTAVLSGDVAAWADASDFTAECK